MTGPAKEPELPLTPAVRLCRMEDRRPEGYVGCSLPEGHEGDHRFNDADLQPWPKAPEEEPHVVELHEAPAPEKKNLPVVTDNPLALVSVLLEHGDRSKETVEIVERLVALQERRDAKIARDAFFTALASFQGDVEPIERTEQGKNTGRESGGSFKYWFAPLPEVVAHVREPLAKHGFSYRWDQQESDDGRRLKTTFHLTHVGGHTESNSVVLPIDSKGGMSEQQKVSSAQSFGMRLSMTAGLGVTSYDPDTDGQTGGAEEELVSEQQAADLETMAGDAKVDKAKFLESLGAETFAKVKKVQLPYAVARLRSKIEKQGEATK